MYLLPWEGKLTVRWQMTQAWFGGKTGRLEFDAQTGSFTVGNMVTGAMSEATGIIFWVDTVNGVLYLFNISGAFQDDEIIYESALGGELLTDGGLESWTGNTPDAPWSKDENGSSTITDEVSIKHGGLHSAKFTMDASANYVTLKQDISYIANNFYVADIWLYGDGVHSIYIQDKNTAGGGLTKIETPSAAWNNYTYRFQANAASLHLYFKRQAGASWSFYSDDNSVKQITNAALANGVLY